MMQKPPPDFKEIITMSNTEQYFLPRIKDGLTTSVKNLSYLRSQHSVKKADRKDSQVLDDFDLANSKKSLNNSKQDILAIEYPTKLVSGIANNTAK
jgi:hypothetical protein